MCHRQGKRGFFVDHARDRESPGYWGRRFGRKKNIDSVGVHRVIYPENRAERERENSTERLDTLSVRLLRERTGILVGSEEWRKTTERGDTKKGDMYREANSSSGSGASTKGDEVELVSRFLAPLCARDEAARNIALAAVRTTVEGWLGGVGSPNHWEDTGEIEDPTKSVVGKFSSQDGR